MIELEKNMVESNKKQKENNRWLIKDFNNMRAIINTVAPSLGEEGTKTTEDLKRQIVLMKKKNIKLFNEKIQFKEDSPKVFQNSKYLEFVS